MGFDGKSGIWEGRTAVRSATGVNVAGSTLEAREPPRLSIKALYRNLWDHCWPERSRSSMTWERMAFNASRAPGDSPASRNTANASSTTKISAHARCRATRALHVRNELRMSAKTIDQVNRHRFFDSDSNLAISMA